MFLIQQTRWSKRCRTDVESNVLWEFDLNELCRWGTLHPKDDWDKITQKIKRRESVEGGFRRCSIDQEGHGDLTQVGREGGKSGKESSGFGVCEWKKIDLTF